MVKWSRPLLSKARHKFLCSINSYTENNRATDGAMQLLQQNKMTLNIEEKHSLYLVWSVHWRAEVENKDRISHQDSWHFHLYIVILLPPETKCKSVFVRSNNNFQLGFKLPQPPHPITKQPILNLAKHNATQGETCLCLNLAFPVRGQNYFLWLTQTGIEAC